MFKILEELQKEKPSQAVIRNLIRDELRLDNESHYCWIADNRKQFSLSSRRKGLTFEMSGYGHGCHEYNQYLLNYFVNGLDLSKNMRFFSLDFYKGSCEFIYEYWEGHNPHRVNAEIEHFGGETTSTIICKIIEICLINNKPKHDRRRD
jgi:hypothetical protein